MTSYEGVSGDIGIHENNVNQWAGYMEEVDTDRVNEEQTYGSWRHEQSGRNLGGIL